MKKNDIITIEIVGMSSEGTGIGKAGSFVIFVPFAAVGDRVEVLIVKVKKSYAYAKLLRVLTPSGDRVEPVCPHYGKCGGCAYFHISHEAELLLKQNQVTENLKRIGGFQSPPVRPILGAGLLGYRNKAQFPVALVDGQAAAGFFAAKSHRLVPVESCAIQSEDIIRALLLVMDFIRRKNIAPYDEETHSGLLRHVYLRAGRATGEVLLCLVLTADQFPCLQEFIAYMTEKMPRIASVLININPDKTNVVLGEKTRTAYGPGVIRDLLCGVEFEISPHSFFQINPAQAEVLYETALSRAGIIKTDTVLDLYCGIGTLTLLAAKRAKRAVGVEIVPDAVENARQNAKRNGIRNAKFYLGPAEDAKSVLGREGLNPDVVLLDPPRKGCERGLLTGLLQLSPRTIVYISCDSATLARDLKILCGNGAYRLADVTPVDMFPRTKHVEAVAVLSRV